MTFRQLIVKNIKGQPRTYFTYFLGSVFSVTLFFIASLLYFHPLLKERPSDGNTRWTMVTLYLPANTLFGGTLIVIGILALLFLITMFRQFLKERHGNLSLYLILGMTKPKLWVMLFWENVIIGLTSILSGIGLGLIFSKFFLLLGQNVIDLDFDLTLYFPWQGMVLTAVIYSGIFLLISLTNLFSLTRFDMNLTLNFAKQNLKEPKMNQYLVYFSPVILLLSYFCLFYLGKFTQLGGVFDFASENMPKSGPWSLALALFFGGGLYFFYDQTLIQSIIFLKKNTRISHSYYLLGLSNLVYRLKKSSTLLFLTTLASFGALLIIASTLALAEVELYGSNEANSLAYTYRAYGIKNKEDYLYHQQNIRFMSSTIEQAGYAMRRAEIDDTVTVSLQSETPIKDFYTNTVTNNDGQKKLHGEQKYLFLLPLSEYNQMAEFKGTPPLQLANNRELAILEDGHGPSQHSYRGQLEYYSASYTTVESVTFKFATTDYNAGVNFSNVAVVTDEFFHKVKVGNVAWEKMSELTEVPSQGSEGEDSPDLAYIPENALEFPFQVLHFREWATAPQVDEHIRSYLLKRQDEREASLPPASASETDLAEEPTFFDYTSSYQTMSIERQERGTTLLVSFLIGSVFLCFTTCIIYFRLFGELNDDSRYHHTLHLIGLTEKERAQLITLEMFITFFLPLVVSILLYLGVVVVAQLVYHYNFWPASLWLISLFLLFQSLLFWFLRRNYFKKINWKVDKHQFNSTV